MRKIPITINDEYIIGSGAVVGAAGSHDDTAFEITFGKNWDGLQKQILWRNAMHADPRIRVLLPTDLVEGTENTYLIPIPAEPKAYPGKMTMTVKGALTEDETETYAGLTAYGEFIVLDSLWDDDAEETQDIDATTAEQVLAAVDEIHSEVTSVTNMTVSSELLQPMEDIWVVKTVEEGHVNLHFAIPKGGKGDKGDRGSFEDMTPEQVEALRENVYAVYSARKAVYIVEANNTYQVEINIEHYNAENDMLSVYVNGLKLTEGFDYSLDTTNKTITLASSLSAGTIVQFEAVQATVEAVSVEGDMDVLDYVDVGVIHTDVPIRSVLVRSSEDLALLTEYDPGTVASTAGFANMWQKSALATWVRII